MKPARIVLVYDVPDWACHVECKAIERALHTFAPGRFDVTLAQGATLTAAAADSFDVLFSTVYYGLAHAGHRRSVSQVSSYSYWIRKAWTAQENCETGVAGWPHLAEWKWIVTKNRDIHARLTDADHPRRRLLYHCLDYEFWTPDRSDVVPARRPRRLGFAGHRDQPLKGYAIVREALDGMPDWTLASAAWEERRLSSDEMRSWYRSLDAYACMSTAGQDAGPRPPMEAGLCGVPVITTRGGQIGEMVEHGVSGLVVERSAEALRAALSRLDGDSRPARELGANARASFASTWGVDVARAWAEYLVEVAES